jgi:alpha-ketoglutarate-dependent taurine dioxygenase
MITEKAMSFPRLVSTVLNGPARSARGNAAIADFATAAHERLAHDGFFRFVLHELDHATVPQRKRVAAELSALIGPPRRAVSSSGTQKDLVSEVRPRADLPAEYQHINVQSVAGVAPLHTDRSFAADAERWFSLWCVRPANDGGDSVLIDGWQVLNDAAVTPGLRIDLEKQAFPLWIGNSATQIPLLTTHATHTQLRWHSRLLRMGLEAEGSTTSAPIRTSFERLASLVEAPERHLVSRLRRNEAVIIDNHRILHGRTHFNDPDRFLLRVRMG